MRKDRTTTGLLLGTLAAIAALSAPAEAVALPDLSGTATFVETPMEGDLWHVTLTLEVTNTGDADAYAVCVDLFWDLPGGAPGPDSESYGGTMLDVVPPFETAVVELTVDYVDDLPHVATFFIDSCELVAESSESNNLVAVPIDLAPPPPPPAELSIESLTASVAAGVITYEATVHNAGPADAGKFAVDVYVDRDGPPNVGDLGQQFVWVEGLAAGATTTIAFPPISAVPGTYASWSLADSLDFEPELDEADNVFGPLTVVVGDDAPALQPDLFLEELDLTTPGGSVTLGLSVSNVGQALAGATRAVAVLDPEGLPTPAEIAGENAREVALPEVAPGSSHMGTASWPGVAPGTHTVWVVLDPEDLVDELNEDNNVTGPLTVHVSSGQPMPDLAVLDVRPTIAGYDVTYEIDVGNLGTASTGPYDLDVFWHSEKKPNVYTGPVPDGGVVADPIGLEPGEERTLTVAWAAAEPGVHQSWASVDTLNVIGELEEKNNVLGPIAVEVLETTGPDLAVVDFKAVVTGNDIIYGATIVNSGDVVSGPFDVDVVYDSEQQPPFGERGDAFKTVPALGPGEEAALSYAVSGAPGGAYESWLLVDSLKQVAETSEGNNTAGPRVFTIDWDALQCEPAALLYEPCVCGETTVSSGYCCDGAWSALPCPEPAEPDAGPADSDAWTPPGGKGDVGPKVAGAPLVEEGGCNGAGSRWAPSSLLLLLLVARARRRRAA
jgi:subtilase family serine protease